MSFVTACMRGGAKRAALALLCLNAGLLHATQAPRRTPRSVKPSARTARLLALSRLDAAVHYFHPVVATRPTRWDASFARFAVAVAEASDSVAYAAALARVLATLEDPQTRVAGPRAVWMAERLPDGSLLLQPSTTSKSSDTLALIQPASVVLDLRNDATELPASALRLLKGVWSTGDERRLQYAGLPQVWFQSANDAHRLTWQRIPGRRFEGQATAQVLVSVLVSERTVLSPLVQALVRSGSATLIGERTSHVTLAATTERIDMGDGVWAQVRMGEPLGGALPVDTVVADAMSAVSTMKRAEKGRRSAAQSVVSLDTTRRVFLAPFPTDPAWMALYPSRGYRILAAVRLWTTVKLFFPYMTLMNEDWDAAFVHALGRVENAPDASGFASALGEFAWRMHDSHVRLTNRTLLRERAPIPLALQLRLVENRLLVTRVPDATSPRTFIRLGDEIVAVDGVPIRKRIQDLESTLIASSPQGARAQVQAHVLDGREGSIPRISLRQSDGTERVVVLPSRHEDAGQLAYQNLAASKATSYRRLENDVGYVDLERLGPEEVDSMFRALADTKAIIFDGRGYPRGTAWAIAGRLKRDLDQRVAAVLSQFVVRGPSLAEPERDVRTWSQLVPRAGILAAHYAGRTALLIDERTMSQAEHLGLFLKEANGTLFIGSPTVGANGDISDIALPGSFRVSFSGLSVRDARGGQLQRRGLQPDVAVTPTVAGIRAHRDQVLEVALRYLLESGR